MSLQAIFGMFMAHSLKDTRIWGMLTYEKLNDAQKKFIQASMNCNDKDSCLLIIEAFMNEIYNNIVLFFVVMYFLEMTSVGIILLLKVAKKRKLDKGKYQNKK